MDSKAVKSRQGVAVKQLYARLGIEMPPEVLRGAPDVFAVEALPILAQQLLDLKAEVAAMKAKKKV
jgi:hypothetical protein